AEGIKVTNPTPYYISFDSAYIVSGNTKSQLKSDMIPPFSTYGFIFAWFVVMFLIVVLTPIKIGVKILIGRFK
ncbi:hypothetical protein HZD82_25110, partial [Pantoea agglomerans]|nr:hypothetical protein [Pantoea agglomerans]